MGMILSSTLLRVAGVLAQWHLRETHGSLRPNGMFESDLAHVYRLVLKKTVLILSLHVL